MGRKKILFQFFSTNVTIIFDFIYYMFSYFFTSGINYYGYPNSRKDKFYILIDVRLFFKCWIFPWRQHPMIPFESQYKLWKNKYQKDKNHHKKSIIITNLMIPMYIVYRPIVGRLVVLYYYISIILDLSFFVILKEFLDPNCCLAQNTNSYNHDVKYGNNEPWLKTVKKNDKSLRIYLG